MLNTLISFEVKQLLFYKNIIKAVFLSTLLVTISFTLMNSMQISKEILLTLLVLWPAVTCLNFSSNILKDDLNNGQLEFLLSSCPVVKIIFTKLFSLLITLLASHTVISLFSSIFFSLTNIEILTLLLTGYLNLIFTAGLTILLASIEIYFDSKTSILASILLPFLAPSLIMSGLTFTTHNFHYLTLLAGIDLVILPLCFWLSMSLIKEIYNN